MGSVIKPEAALVNAALLNKTAHGTGKNTGVTAPAAQSVHNQAAQNLPNQAGVLSAQAQVKIPAAVIPSPSTPAPALTGAMVFKAAAAALGLPPDALTNALLTFARFFSVTPESALLSNLRKEVLASGASSPKTAKERTAMESKALALLAALDKGVALNRDGLDEYASVPGNSDFSGQHGNQKKRGQNHNFDEKEELDAQDIKKLFEKSGQSSNERDILDLLNRIPGKNGQRWIVWPFNISSGGTELQVLIRILIKEPVNHSIKGQSTGENAGGRLFADILGPKRTWHFSLNKSGQEKLEVNGYVFPGFPKKDLKSFEKELQSALKNLALETEFHLWNDEQPSLTMELDGEILPAFNKEV